MKILLLGDASNYHRTLATGLRRMGHDVTVASSGSSFMNTDRDINLARQLPGKAGGLLLWLKLKKLLSKEFRGYDVVQISNPIFVNLRPHLVRKIFDELRRNNKIVCLSALGTDTPYIQECLDPESPLKYNEWRIGSKPGPEALVNPQISQAWLNDPLASHCRHIYENVDCVISDLYEYHIASQRFASKNKLVYGGIPITIPDTIPQASSDGKVRILMAYHSHRLSEKGTDRLIEMCQKIEREIPSLVHVDYVHDVTFKEFSEHIAQAHIVVDQLYSYTPATTALMAMAMGKVAVSGGEPEYYDFIEESTLRPIINANPFNLDGTCNRIIEVVRTPKLLESLSKQSREFAIKHNSDTVVAKRFIDQWKNLL